MDAKGRDIIEGEVIPKWSLKDRDWSVCQIPEHYHEPLGSSEVSVFLDHLTDCLVLQKSFSPRADNHMTCFPE
jgi:hypothetical protein